MASWCRQDAELAERGRLDGCQIDRPEGIDPLDDECYERLRILLWSDLHRVGYPLRKIASLFNVSKNRVDRSLKSIPQYVWEERKPVGRYLSNLKEVVDLDPNSLPKFAELLQRRAGTHGFEQIAFHNAGIRRSSVHTMLGTPRKSQAKPKAAK